jgi:CRP-like cAMP-binding protein
MEVFSEASPECLSHVAAKLSRIQLEPGDMLFRCNPPGAAGGSSGGGSSGNGEEQQRREGLGGASDGEGREGGGGGGGEEEEEEDMTDSMYFIESGKIELVAAGGAGQQVVSRLL